MANRNFLEGVDRLTPRSSHVEVFDEVSFRAHLVSQRVQ